jgi:hypothetical protein
VKLDANLIRIDGGVSKVREPRNVTIQPNLAAGLAVLINRAERRFWKVRLLLNIDSTKATMKTSAHWTAFTMLKTRPAFLLSCESAAAACAARFF